MTGRALRIGLAAIVAAVLSLLLAWLVARVPVLAWALYGVGALALGWTLLSSIRSEQRTRALLGLGLTMAMSFALVAVVGLVTEDGDDAADARDTAASAGESSTGTASPPTSSTSNGPSSSTSSGTSSSRSTSTSAATTTTTSTTAPGPPPLRTGLVDPVDDCGCADELASLDVAAEGATVALEIGVGGDGTSPLWLWNTAEPGQPIVVVPADEGEVRDGGWAVTVPTPGDGATWAVVSESGDRIPDTGYLAAGAEVIDATGAVAARLGAEVAETQRRIPSLDPVAADLATSLLARQTLRGTAVFRGNTDEADVVVTIVNDWPAFSQRLDIDGVYQQSIHIDAERALICDPTPDGVSCVPFDGNVPVSSAVAIARAPDQLVVGNDRTDVFSNGEIVDRAIRCVTVESTPPGGPTTGETCWLDSGMSATTGQVTLQRIDPTPAAELLPAPEGA